MLGTIRKILAYVDWLAMVAFVIVFGIYLLPHSMAGAIVAWCVAAFLIFIMFADSSKKFMLHKCLNTGTQISNPLIDIAIFAMGTRMFIEKPDLYFLVLTGMIMVSIDILLWLIVCFEAWKNKRLDHFM